MPFALDAATLHPSTALALSALEWLEHRIHPATILDMGCGNGVLSLASVHLWDASALACDISEEALRDTRANIRQFAEHAPITTLRSDGFKHPGIRHHAPYDLILANLLAQWQVQMACDIKNHLNPGGHVLLSGMLLWQENGVADAFRTIDIDIIHTIRHEDWVCLVGQHKMAG